MSRLISGQYGTVFTHSEYGKIQKVYSIWFCVNPAGYMKNTISGISLKPDVIFGDPKLKPDAVDLMRGIIVSLGEARDTVDNDILKLMNTLLSSTVSADEKKRVMRDDFKIAMTEELESEVAEMCNLSQSVREQALGEGRVEGRKEGRLEGRLEGRKEGRLEAAIEVAKKLIAFGTMTLEAIAEVSGLPLTKVKELAGVQTA